MNYANFSIFNFQFSIIFRTFAVENRKTMSENKMNWARIWEITRKYILNKYIIVLLVFGVVMIFVGNQSAVQRVRRARTIDSLRTERDMYYDRSQRLDDKLRSLRSSKDSLERFARERYLMHCENEDVYIVKDEE